jgi:hypothetical protein
LLSQSYGFIVIKSKPSGAEVIINGKTTDKKTPFQTQLEPGDYKFSLKYEMYHQFEDEFSLKRGQTITKEAYMKPAYGSLKISSEPQGASLRLDGIIIAQKTSATLENISSGQHTISLSMDMYSDTSKVINIDDESTTEEFIELQPEYGTIGIKSNPDGLIYIDGLRVDSGRYSGRISPGNHQVEVKRNKFYPEKQDIFVQRGQETKVDFQLRPILGALSVMVDPPETSISLNGKYYGMSPKMIDSLPVGDYDLELTKDEYASLKQHLIIEENNTKQINISLKKGKLIKIFSEPEGAELFYNGSIAGLTPAEIIVMDGSNKLVLKKKYFSDKEVFITAERNNQEYNFKLEIDRKTVNIGITTNPALAVFNLKEKEFLSDASSFTANDQKVYSGVSPDHLQLPIGKYELNLSKNGFKSVTKEVILEKEENITFTLQPLKYRTKGKALLLSVIWPGAGQSYLKRGSAHFVMGFVAYGSLAYGIFEYSEAVKNYDLYLVLTDKQERESKKSEWGKNLDRYHYSLYCGAAVWGINLIWTLATQSEPKKYKNVQFSLLNTPNGSVPAIGLHYSF